jgi:hypothetical protein
MVQTTKPSHSCGDLIGAHESALGQLMLCYDSPSSREVEAILAMDSASSLNTGGLRRKREKNMTA